MPQAGDVQPSSCRSGTTGSLNLPDSQALFIAPWVASRFPSSSLCSDHKGCWLGPRQGWTTWTQVLARVLVAFPAVRRRFLSWLDSSVSSCGKEQPAPQEAAGSSESGCSGRLTDVGGMGEQVAVQGSEKVRRELFHAQSYWAGKGEGVLWPLSLFLLLRLHQVASLEGLHLSWGKGVTSAPLKDTCPLLGPMEGFVQCFVACSWGLCF